MSNEYTVKLYEGEALRGILRCREEENLLRILQSRGYMEHVPCGGKGICGACGVQIIKGAPLPGNGDRKLFSPEQLRKGMRLSCTVRVKGEMEVLLPKAKEEPAVLLKSSIPSAGGVQAEAADAADKADKAGIAVSKTGLPKAILAVDIGTTTIAMELRGTSDGRILGQYAALNPQRKFGADVLSRIEAACRSAETAETLKEQLRSVLRGGISYFEESVPEWMEKDTPVFLAGNTVMEHLFMGHSVEGLGKHPFAPVTLDWQETECAGHRVVLLPGFSAFVGADITAGAAALGMLKMIGSAPHRNVLLIDLGTNAEMVYVHDGFMTVTATAAGPAFEGGITAGVFGADLIRMAAELLDRKILDETGLLQGEAFEQGAMLDERQDGRPGGIRVTNDDIRKLQLAKAAVAAGVELLGIPGNAEVYLAGGFGYYLDPESACRIGLLPGIKKEQIHAVGNIVPAGIFTMAGEYLADDAYAAEVAEQLQEARIVNLAKEADFNEIYVRHINFNENAK